MMFNFFLLLLYNIIRVFNIIYLVKIAIRGVISTYCVLRLGKCVCGGDQRNKKMDDSERAGF